MTRSSLAFGILCTLAAAGCGGESGPTVNLAEATGLVTYQNAPVAGATVTFVPEKGPIATAVTDLEGKFTLMTAGRKGVAVGDCKVSITASAGGGSAEAGAPTIDMTTPPASPEEAKARMEALNTMQRDMQQNKKATDQPKSLIPEKYATAQTSGLKATVTTDASKNNFEFKL